ncbi:MAG: FKBP-type peptidyl-prolyl cis-trans isomerase [Ferruginibacter sp.]|nr:FKBP-type peptidyl-prolyl cis-trans isomerase [Ferruginibacter sp.]
MKQFFLAVSVLVISGETLQAQVKPKLKVVNPAASNVNPVTRVLKNSTDSFSYALGLNIANNLKQQGIDKISNAAMQKGLDDVFNKKTFLLNEQQANLVIQQMIQACMGKKNEIVKAKGTAFLAANKKRPGVITLPDGLQYEVLKKGDASSATPKLQDTVVVHYAGTSVDGKKFDNSYERGEPLTIAVGGVIRGWTEILQLMHIGDKWKVFIPSELGYGDRDAGANIPGGSALIFEMELLGIKPAPAEEPAK